MFSFDHDLGQFVSIGTASVSEDGLVIRSDPGVGILKGGWHEGGGGPDDPGDAEPVTVKILSQEDSEREPRSVEEPRSGVEVRAATTDEVSQKLIASVGQTVEVVAEGRPVSGTSQPFTWTSSDPEVARIDGTPQNTTEEEVMKSTATVLGIKPGKATLTVRYTTNPNDSDKAKTDTVDVRVPRRFRINVTTFIPFPYGLPPGGIVPGLPPRLLVGAGDNRDFAANATSFRTRQLVTVQTGSNDAIVEPPQNIAADSTAHTARIDDGTISPEPFLTCQNDSSNIHVNAAKLDNETVLVVLTGSAKTCFLPLTGSLLTIDWCYTILITDPAD